MSRRISSGGVRGGHAVLLAILAATACSGPPDVSAPPAGVATLIGTVSIPIAGSGLASPAPSAAMSCTGQGVLADINEGTEIVVRDGAGTILQTGLLGPGKVTQRSGGQTCSFVFEVPDIPLGENFYTVQVADRAVKIYSADELETLDWTIAIAPIGAN